MERLITVAAGGQELHRRSGGRRHPQRAASDGSVVIGRSASGQPRTYRVARPSRGRSAVDVPPRAVAAAYRHLLVVLLGLDPGTLVGEFRAARLRRSRNDVQPSLAA